jgi:predicted alpha/beta superfamily hydrolase
MMKQLFVIILLVFYISNSYAQTNYTPKVKYGTVIHLKNFVSAYVPARDIDILLPPNYFTTTDRYPVVYMHDGQMLFDTTYTWNHQEWEVDETLQRLTDSNLIHHCIIVAIHSISRFRYAELYPTTTRNYLTVAANKRLQTKMSDTTDANKYLTFLAKEVKLYVDNNYRTMTGPKHTAIAGSSMGGLISWYAVCEYPMVFGKAICLSTHWPGGNPKDKEASQLFNSFYKYLINQLPEPYEAKFYFTHGGKTLDSFYTQYQKKVNTVFKQKKFTKKEFRFVNIPEAAHDEKSWAHQLDEALVFMFGKINYP